MNKCYANVSGGVGNQLFQIAATHAYGKRHGKESFIDCSRWHASQGKNPSEYQNTIFKNFKYEVAGDVSCIREKRFGYDELPCIDGNVSLEGYFQSIKYFEDYIEEIKNLINLPTVKTDFIKDKNVAFHIRRGDYLNYGDLFIFGNEYFKNQFLNFKDYQINVFTDSHEIVLREFGGYDFNLIQTSSEINDLTLISQHDNVVCSNSSFSWWASFLGKEKEKIIVPNFWMKGHDCSDIYRSDMTIELI